MPAVACYNVGMIEVAEAQTVVLRHSRPLPPHVGPPISGRVLAEEVVSDLDMPPFDKAMMDGFAVRSDDLSGDSRVFDVIDEITAGQTPQKTIGPGQAARIMTGAPMPGGADAVVMIERCELAGENAVRIPGPVAAGQNVQPRAREMRRGEPVLAAGSLLRAQEIGLLGIVGRPSVLTHPAPRVAVVATGDELVEPDHEPGPGQIRNSNAPMLVAQAASAGGHSHYLGIARDNVSHLWQLIGDGLTHDVLLLTGGVSAGKLDLVPEVLRDLGVTAHFHKVRMKPGKPVLFGTRGDTLVFGLPGNPVSAFVCFELFVRPALRRLAGHADGLPEFVSMPLADEFPCSTDRPTYHPARTEATRLGEQVRPVAWHGSPDLRALTAANALLLLPPGEHVHRAGDAVSILRLTG
jgi:molybdopterin molybdotransferase